MKNIKKILTGTLISAISVTAIGCGSTNTKLAKNIDKSMADFVSSINNLDYVDTTSPTSEKIGKIVETSANPYALVNQNILDGKSKVNSNKDSLSYLNEKISENKIENTITRPTDRKGDFSLFVLSDVPFVTLTSEDNKANLTFSFKFSTNKIEEASTEIDSKINELILKRSILMIYVNEIYNNNVNFSEENKVAINAYLNVIRENTSFLNGNRGMVKNQLSLANDLVKDESNDDLVNYYIIKSGEALETRSNKLNSTISAIDSIINIIENNLASSSNYYNVKLSGTYDKIISNINSDSNPNIEINNNSTNQEIAKSILDSLEMTKDTMLLKDESNAKLENNNKVNEVNITEKNANLENNNKNSTQINPNEQKNANLNTENSNKQDNNLNNKNDDLTTNNQTNSNTISRLNDKNIDSKTNLNANKIQSNTIVNRDLNNNARNNLNNSLNQNTNNILNNNANNLNNNFNKNTNNSLNNNTNNNLNNNLNNNSNKNTNNLNKNFNNISNVNNNSITKNIDDSNYQTRINNSNSWKPTTNLQPDIEVIKDKNSSNDLLNTNNENKNEQNNIITRRVESGLPNETRNNQEENMQNDNKNTLNSSNTISNTTKTTNNLKKRRSRRNRQNRINLNEQNRNNFQNMNQTKISQDDNIKTMEDTNQINSSRNFKNNNEFNSNNRNFNVTKQTRVNQHPSKKVSNNELKENDNEKVDVTKLGLTDYPLYSTKNMNSDNKAVRVPYKTTSQIKK